MKALQVELQIKRVTMNEDDSVSFTASTPELQDSELAEFRKLRKVLVNALLEPQSGSEGILEVKEKIDDGKTPSQRLRGILYVWWEQLGKPNQSFNLFYELKIEKIIESIKSKLD